MLKRHTKLAVIAAALALMTGLAGCATHLSEKPNAEASERSSAPGDAMEQPAEAVTPGWPVVNESGTGPSTITIQNPSRDAAYLMASFSCSTGEGSVTLLEDTRVYIGGTCGGGSGYQMPLPTDATQYTIQVDIAADATFRFSGTFAPAS